MREAYVPRGPVPATPESIGALVDWARGAKVAKLRLEPEAPVAFADVLLDRGFVKGKPTQPEHTRILELKPPEEMLASFKQGRRYNIRTGLKRGAVVEEGKDAAEVGPFDRYHAKLFNYYVRLTGDRALSEDLVQDVLLSVHAVRAATARVEADEGT